MKKWLCALAITCGGAAQAVELQVPSNARQLIARDTVQDRYFAPIGPYAEGKLPTQMYEGAIARSAWRVDAVGLTPLQLIMPMREQLTNAGFRIVLDCAASECGGYDFRFATEVLPAPNMYVNIRNYHVITAEHHGLAGPELVTILTSASGGVSFIQIIQAGEITAEGTIAPDGGETSVPEAAGNIAETLFADGRAVLSGLTFKSGTFELGEGPFSVLADLAQALRLRPEMRVALVGHTDNVGNLDGNIGLSQNRANSVRTRLIERYEIAPQRLEAQGLGYLAPYTSNLSEEGRKTNRRVEAVLLTN